VIHRIDQPPLRVVAIDQQFAPPPCRWRKVTIRASAIRPLSRARSRAQALMHGMEIAQPRPQTSSGRALSMNEVLLNGSHCVCSPPGSGAHRLDIVAVGIDQERGVIGRL
jgi:hypothetical protein